ncbi:MAG: hypothetical protein ACKVPY_09990 [Paracoccaceae bacterium]
MFRFGFLPAAFAALSLSPLPALAQSSLGLSFAEAAIEAGSASTSRGAARLTGAWAITPSHGVQLGLSLTDYPSGYVGQVSGQVYMSPAPEWKYGFSASLADASNREATIATAGVAAIWAPTERTAIQGTALLGYARPRDIDFVTFGLSAETAISARSAVFADLTVTAVDEAVLSATATTGRIGLRHAFGDFGPEASLALASDRLTGRDAAPRDTRVEFALTWRFGGDRAGRVSARDRAFAEVKPFDPFLRRGLF